MSADAFPADILVVLVAFPPVLYLSSFFHKVGHAVMATRSGLVVSSFGLGLGRPFWLGSWRGTRIFLCLHRPFQGVTWFIYPQIYPSRLAMIGALVGGVLAHIVLALTAGFFWWLLPWGQTLWLVIAVLNGILALVNLIPLSVRVGTLTLRSDGALIAEIFWRGRPRVSAPAIFQMVKSLAGFWQEIGDTRAYRAFLLTSAALWLNFGETEKAEALLAMADSVPVEDSTLSRAFAATIRGLVYCAKERSEVSAYEFDRAEQLFTELNHQEGIFLVAVGRSKLALQRNDTTGALACLDPYRAHPLVAAKPFLRVILLELLLCVRAASLAEEEVEHLRAEYEGLRRCYSSPAIDLWVYRTLGNFYSQKHDWSKAESAYTLAVQTARQIYLEFADKEDQARFRKCQESLLNEAGSCLKQLGKEEEAKKLHAALPTPLEVDQLEDNVKKQRIRSYRRASLLLALIELMVGLSLLAFAGFFTTEPEELFFMEPDEFPVLLIIFGFLLLAFSQCVWFGNLVIYLTGLFLPKVRSPQAYLVLLMLAIVPLLLFVLIIGFILIGL